MRTEQIVTETPTHRVTTEIGHHGQRFVVMYDKTRPLDQDDILHPVFVMRTSMADVWKALAYMADHGLLHTTAPADTETTT